MTRRWIESDPPRRFPAARKLAITRLAAQANPDDITLQANVGDALMALDRFEEAAQIYAAIGQGRLSKLAHCYIALGRADDAVAVCDSFDMPDNSNWHLMRGTALLLAGRAEEGRRELWRAITLGDPELLALEALLRSISRTGDAETLLETCDALDERYSGSSAVRGYRALALSMLGRNDAAGEIVDLDRAVMRVRFEPPAEFGGIEAFNKALAEDIVADPPPAPYAEGTLLNPMPYTRGNPRLIALRAAIRAAIADYADRHAEFGEPAALPPPPERASIGCGSVVLTGPGRNREHLHRAGYISTVYHVQVPDEIVQANDGRGALLLGPCGSYAKGHKGCWGTRSIPAEPGWLTLFPSHIFHDVAPTLVSTPRVSVVSDIKPAWQDA